MTVMSFCKCDLHEWVNRENHGRIETGKKSAMFEREDLQEARPTPKASFVPNMDEKLGDDDDKDDGKDDDKDD